MMVENGKYTYYYTDAWINPDDFYGKYDENGDLIGDIPEWCDIDVLSVDDDKRETYSFDYPNFSVTWDGMGAYKILNTCIGEGLLENYKNAFKNGIIEESTLEDALKCATHINDECVAAVLLDMLHEDITLNPIM